MLLCPGMSPRTLLAGLLLLAALIAVATAQEKKALSRPLRVRVRSPDDTGAVQARPLYSAGTVGARRPRGYPLGTRARNRMMINTPLKPDDRSHEVKHVASESVYVVSMNSQGKSQPVYRAAVTKRKILEEPEEEFFEPKDVSVRVVSSQSVLVSWVDPIFEKTKKVESSRHYSIRYREKGESARWDYKQVNNRRTLVDQLMADTMYEFSVRISQGDRHSQWSASVFQRTPESAPTGAPESFDVWPFDGKGTAVSASWEPPSESSGKVKEYILSYAPALKPFGGKSITYPGDTTSAIIDGLQPGERYVFKIRAANRRGQGPPSKAFSVAMPATSSVDDQQVDVQDTLELLKTSTTMPPPSVRASSPSPGLDAKTLKNSMSKLKNAFTRDGSIIKSGLPFKKAAQIEPKFQSAEVTDDDDIYTETSTPIPKTSASPQRRNIQPSLNNRSVPSGRTPFRVRPPALSRNTNDDKQASSPSVSSSPSSSSEPPPFPGNANKKTMDLSHGYSYIPSPSPASSNSVPAEEKDNDSIDDGEEESTNPEPLPPKHRLPAKVFSKPSRLPSSSNPYFGKKIHSTKSRDGLRGNTPVNGALHTHSSALVPSKAAPASKSHKTLSSRVASKPGKVEMPTVSQPPASSMPVRPETSPQLSPALPHLGIDENQDEYSAKETTSISDKTTISPTVHSPRIAARRKPNPAVHEKLQPKLAISKKHRPSHQTKAYTATASDKSTTSLSVSHASDNTNDTKELDYRDETSISANSRLRLPSPSPSPGGTGREDPVTHTSRPSSQSHISSAFIKNKAHLHDISPAKDKSATGHIPNSDSTETRKTDTKEQKSDFPSATNHAVPSSGVPSSGHFPSSKLSSGQNKIGNAQKHKLPQPTVTPEPHTSIRTTTHTIINTEKPNHKPAKNAVVHSLAPKLPSIPSFAGQSASEILEYYKRRSSQVRRTSGRKVMMNQKEKTETFSTSSAKPSQDISPSPSSKAPLFGSHDGHIIDTDDLSGKSGTPGIKPSQHPLASKNDQQSNVFDEVSREEVLDPKTSPIPSFSTTLSSALLAKKHSPLLSSSSKKMIGSWAHDTGKLKDAFNKSGKNIPLTPSSKKIISSGSTRLSSLNISSGYNASQKMVAAGPKLKTNPSGVSQSKIQASMVNSQNPLATPASPKRNFKLNGVDSEDEDTDTGETIQKQGSSMVLPKHISHTSSSSSATSPKASPTPAVSKLQPLVAQTGHTEENRKQQDVLPSSEVFQSSGLPKQHISSEATSGGKHSPVLAKQPSTSAPLYDLPQSKQLPPDLKSASNNGKFGQHATDISLSLKVPSTPIRRPLSSLPNYRPGLRVANRIGGSQGLRKLRPSKFMPSKYSRMSLSTAVKSSSTDDEDADNHDSQKEPEEIKENPTSSSRTIWASASVGHKNKNLNTAIDNTKPRGSLLPKELLYVDGKDEKGLRSPPILNHSFLPRSAVPSPSAVSRGSKFPRKINSLLKTTASTTILPTSSTRTALPYLHSSLSRQSSEERPPKLTPSSSPTIAAPHTASSTHSPSPLPPSLRHRIQGSRIRSPLQRPFARPPYRHANGNNGRPNLTTKVNISGKLLPSSNGKPSGQRIINGPQGTKWIVDLNRGLVFNHEGRYLQDSQGKPLRIKLGGDGRTIVDLQGTPLVSPDGLPFFGSGRFSKPVASAQDKPILSLGGKPLIGLEAIKTTRLPTTTPTTTTTTTTTPTTTTRVATTPEPTTVEPTTEELLMPTCPPGSYGQYDEEGNLLMGPDDLPDCYPEDNYSGLETEAMMTTDATEATESVTYLDLDQDYEIFETTFPPTVEVMTTVPSITEEMPEVTPFKPPSLSNLDVAGKERFTAPYVSYISKDPEAPCSLTDALEHFQVESLAELIPTGLTDQLLPSQNITYNITVVAVEGCHSFIILDWAKPMEGDFITGYLVYSASYDDYLRNKWSTRPAGGTHLPIENLKPNTRYYFKVQAKNPYGYAPASPWVTFVTESDNPLLIVRPPGGEPIWIPFAFKYDPSYAECYGKQYVKRTWYRKFVGVVLCNSLRYKIYLSDNLRDTFYSIGDRWGRGEDHCQFVDSYMDGRTGPQFYTEVLPPINGYQRQYRQEPVTFGRIGYGTPYHCAGWYECGATIPGKW